MVFLFTSQLLTACFPDSHIKSNQIDFLKRKEDVRSLAFSFQFNPLLNAVVEQLPQKMWKYFSENQWVKTIFIPKICYPW
jgi:hypothetical protein